MAETSEARVRAALGNSQANALFNELEIFSGRTRSDIWDFMLSMNSVAHIEASLRVTQEGKPKCLALCDDTLDCCAPDCPCAAKPLTPDAEDGASMIEIVRPTAAELWESLESFLNSLHKGVCGEESPEGLGHAQFVVMALRPMIAALSGNRPEGEAKVSYRVNYAFIDNPHNPGRHSLDFASREQAEDFIAEDIPAEISFLEKLIISHVKIETYETVIETRKKEA